MFTKEFFKTASREQIQSFLESQGHPSAAAYANIIYSHHHEELWETITPEELERRIEEMMKVSGKQ